MADNISQKQALQQWNDYVENIRKATALYTGETDAQQKRRKETLEADPELWFKYYFPNYSYAEPAPFHRAATKRVLNNLEWYEVRAWSRELAKSTRTMMEMLYLILTKKKRYLLMISNSKDNAIRLLDPYRGNLEGNQRIINDYGHQVLPGSWTAEEFTTRGGAAFRALGAGQSPRGTRNEEVRPDIILYDDIDTDEECRNTDIIETKWAWIEDAAMATRSISNALTVIFCGNIIAEHCCVKRAMKFADKTDIVNIRDKNGVSSWPQKNSEEAIDRVLEKKSYASQQKEYFNNPISQGQIFKEMKYGKCPPLSSLQFAIIYGDPSTSNKDRPSAKSKSSNSTKAVVILGSDGTRYYLYKVWVDHMTNAKFIDALFEANKYCREKKAKAVYTYIENNTLQDPFYEQVLRPLILAQGKASGFHINVTPDTRKKPEKFFRIEATLEPVHRNGYLILNEKEKEDLHMKRCDAQFRSFSPTSKTIDAPDAVEGAAHQAKNKIAVSNAGGLKVYPMARNNKRW